MFGHCLPPVTCNASLWCKMKTIKYNQKAKSKCLLDIVITIIISKIDSPAHSSYQCIECYWCSLGGFAVTTIIRENPNHWPHAQSMPVFQCGERRDVQQYTVLLERRSVEHFHTIAHTDKKPRRWYGKEVERIDMCVLFSELLKTSRHKFTNFVIS